MLNSQHFKYPVHIKVDDEINKYFNTAVKIFSIELPSKKVSINQITKNGPIYYIEDVSYFLKKLPQLFKPYQEIFAKVVEIFCQCKLVQKNVKFPLQQAIPCLSTLTDLIKSGNKSQNKIGLINNTLDFVLKMDIKQWSQLEKKLKKQKQLDEDDMRRIRSIVEIKSKFHIISQAIVYINEADKNRLIMQSNKLKKQTLFDEFERCFLGQLINVKSKANQYENLLQKYSIQENSNTMITNFFQRTRLKEITDKDIQQLEFIPNLTLRVSAKNFMNCLQSQYIRFTGKDNKFQKAITLLADPLCSQQQLNKAMKQLPRTHQSLLQRIRIHIKNLKQQIRVKKQKQGYNGSPKKSDLNQIISLKQSLDKMTDDFKFLKQENNLTIRKKEQIQLQIESLQKENQRLKNSTKEQKLQTKGLFGYNTNRAKIKQNETNQIQQFQKILEHKIQQLQDLQKYVQNLQKDLKQKNQILQKLKKSQASQAKIDIKDDKIEKNKVKYEQQLKNQNNRIKQQYQKQTLQLQKLKQKQPQFQILYQQLSHYKSNCEKISLELKKQKQQKNNLKAIEKLFQPESNKKNYQNNNTQIIKLNEKHKKQLDLKNNQILNLKKQLQQRSKQLQKLKKSQEEQQRKYFPQIQSLKQQLSSCKAKYDKIVRQFEKQKQQKERFLQLKIDNDKVDYTEYNNKLNNLRINEKVLRRNLTNLQNQHQTLKNQMQKLQVKFNQLNDQLFLASSKKQQQSLQHQYINLKENYQSLLIVLNLLKAQIQNKRENFNVEEKSEIKTLKDELNSQKIQLNSLTQVNNRNISSKEQKICLLQIKIIDLQSQLQKNTHLSDCQRLKQKISNISSQMGKLSNQNMQLRSTLTQKQHQILLLAYRQ